MAKKDVSKDLILLQGRPFEKFHKTKALLKKNIFSSIHVKKSVTNEKLTSAKCDIILVVPI